MIIKALERPQTNTWHREEETQNTGSYTTTRTKLKYQVHGDYNTREETRKNMTKQGPSTNALVTSKKMTPRVYQVLTASSGPYKDYDTFIQSRKSLITERQEHNSLIFFCLLLGRKYAAATQ